MGNPQTQCLCGSEPRSQRRGVHGSSGTLRPARSSRSGAGLPCLAVGGRAPAGEATGTLNAPESSILVTSPCVLTFGTSLEETISKSLCDSLPCFAQISDGEPWYASVSMDAAPLGDVAREFGISRDTLYRLVRHHGLQTYRRAGDRRTWVDRDEIRPLVALRPKKPPADVEGSECPPT